MTAEGKQCLLRYLGYAPGAVDGIWGERSEAALARFQKAEGLPQGEEPEAALLDAVAQGRFCREADFWQGIQYFTRAEFRCTCGRCGGFPVEPDETLVRLADRVREHFGAPANVSSGVRCQAHNDELPGSAKNSYHLRGKAMDFCVRGVSGEKLLAYVKTQQVHYAYQISGSDYVHMDVN